MAILLGIDTGGTYTDAVLLRDERDVLAKAKSLTTRHDLALGIGEAMQTVLHQSGADPADVALVSMSTTLATNALIEGHGGRVALVAIGFDDKDLDRHGLTEALKGDPVIKLAGGHSHAGREAAPLDLDTLRAWLKDHGEGISGFAVAGVFATRNPAHETAAEALIKEITGRPVSCSHHLSSKLNGPKRAMTAVLNARLVGMIDHLISATQTLMHDRGIHAPLMVVRGDGALISSEMARARPIETILSGPAASIVGARWLTGEKDALVSDIGGTTTDVALLRNGVPMIDPDGARVGEFRTMVEAVAMRTTGLGGDSQVHLIHEGLRHGLCLGPLRAVPIALTAHNWPDLVHKTLDSQLTAEIVTETDGCFVLPVLRDDLSASGLNAREADVLSRLADGPRPLSGLLKTRMEAASFKRLVERRLVMLSALTPSDASHVLGRMEIWDGEAARKAMEILARRYPAVIDGPEDMAQRIIDQLTEQTSLLLLETAFEEDPEFDGDARALARHVLTQRGLKNHRGLIAADVHLNLPVVGLGASAHAYYPAVGDRLRAPMDLPEHAEVANALGAIVGQISIRETALITAPAKGVYRLHLPDGTEDFPAEDAAITALKSHLELHATQAARDAGAEDLRVSFDEVFRRTGEETIDDLLEAELTVTVTGRPRIALEG